METQSEKPSPNRVFQPTGSPYCTDPNCEYCNRLRRAEDQVRKGASA